ncbi:YciI family protein [Planococcus sp. APC 3906]|uniref:YciI family protein n=1 Tax=Planococcus sp. APC 3906 TaxID=3035194 RepID=UPI0025B33A57|nr:YciI family protein [Planococcus sp. APC 3906]MDN3451741.1 YciI family protein [Planococcus sp. APC 3906]
MLFMLVVKASPTSEAGTLPSLELMDAMSKYNKDLIEAGVRVMAKGLYPSSHALRFSYTEPGEKPVATEGPFANPKETISGFILIDVESREAAIEWAMRMPDPIGHGEGEVELHQVFEGPGEE